MNHRPRAERVYLQYTVTVTDDPALTRRDPVLDQRQLRAGKIYSVPGGGGPGAVHTRSRTWVAPRSGRIVAAAAHAHGGALSVSVASRGAAGAARLGRPLRRRRTTRSTSSPRCCTSRRRAA